MEIKKYEIGDKIFIQKPLVLGQWREIGDILKEIAIPRDINPISLITSLGNKLFAVLAVILTEEGRSPRGKDIPQLAEEMEYGITPKTAIEALADFFECNPIPSLLSNLWSLAETVHEKTKEIGLTNSASSSVAQTSPGETGFSGM